MLKKYILFIIFTFLSSNIKAQYIDAYDYLNLKVGNKSTNEFTGESHLKRIISPIEHTATYSNNIITYIRVRITLYRNGERVYSKIHILKGIKLAPYDIDYFTFYVDKIFPFLLEGDPWDAYYEFLPYE